MKVVHLSTYDLYGGAAKAAHRLHVALTAAGIDSKMLVRRRESDRADVAQPMGQIMKLWLRLQRRCDRLILAANGGGSAGFSPGAVPDGLARHIRELAPDVVHLHWVADGFFRIETLQKIASPVVWTMHDMWPFTGGCHYAGSCEAFAAACGRCPALTRPREFDLARRGWERRQLAFAGGKVVFVAPSRWMAEQAGRSALLRAADIRIISNGIDTACFAPQDRAVARMKLALPHDKILVLTGAARLTDNTRKGFLHFVSALKLLRTLIPPAKVELALFGSRNLGFTELEGFKVHNLGVLEGNEALVCAYASSDVFVAPSLEDNLPNTVMEAMAVGIPIVAYDAGGIPEMVDDGKNGLLAPTGLPEALGRALARMLNDESFRNGCRQPARDKILDSFGGEKSAAKYRELYEELIRRT